MPTGKKQHYVPRFLIRRFAVDQTDPASLAYKLDIRTGKPWKVSPASEAKHDWFYRITTDDGEIDDSADELLTRLENDAARVIRSIADVPSREPTVNEIRQLALFIVTLKQRTPEGREQLREADIRTAELTAEVRLSDPQLSVEMAGIGKSVEEVDRERRQLLQDLRDGRVEFGCPPSREVALMFGAIEEGATFLCTEMSWTCQVAPPGHSFVLSDHPVAHYDPTPKVEGAGAGFASSPNSQTTVPIDRRVVLLLCPSRGWSWRTVRLTPGAVDATNLLVYAQAREAIFGESQALVTGVRRIAKAEPAARARFARRPTRIWVADADEAASGGVRTFTSTYKGETISGQLYAPPDAERRARGRAWPAGSES